MTPRRGVNARLYCGLRLALRAALLVALVALAGRLALAARAGAKPQSAAPAPESAEEPLDRVKRVLRNGTEGYTDYLAPGQLLSRLQVAATSDAIRAVATLHEVTKEVQELAPGWDDGRGYWASSLLQDLYGAGARFSKEGNRTGVSDTLPAFEAVGNACLDDLRVFVSDPSLPLPFRVEAARLLATLGVSGGGADFVKLFLRQNPATENTAVATNGEGWVTASETYKVSYVLGFITAAGLTPVVTQSGTWFSHRVGAYVLELDVFYGKPENRSVTLAEAMFRANDALRTP